MEKITFPGPFYHMGYPSQDLLPDGGFGAILARAGVGKTAFLVQLALNKLLRDQNVLHISLSDPVDKVNLWYEEVFRNIAEKHRFTQKDRCWETILPNRFIMTFRAEGFSVPKLEERLTDLSEQGIFFPRMMAVDGLRFEETTRKTLTAFKELAAQYGLHAWFTVMTHRHEPPGPDGMPVPMLNVADLFEVVLELKPEEKAIQVKPLKGGPADGRPLRLDPATMLVKNGDG